VHFIDGNGNAALDDVVTPHGTMNHAWVYRADAWRFRQLIGMRVRFQANLIPYDHGISHHAKKHCDDFTLQGIRNVEIL
jgi:hypothetical protein